MLTGVVIRSKGVLLYIYRVYKLYLSVRARFIHLREYRVLREKGESSTTQVGFTARITVASNLADLKFLSVRASHSLGAGRESREYTCQFDRPKLG
jgi:hypothetical protein